MSTHLLSFEDLDRWALQALGVPLRLYLVPVPSGQDERPCARSALGSLWAVHGLPGPAPTSWPSPRVSVSHTRSFVALTLAQVPLEGVGVDVEDLDRVVDERSGRFFLTPAERQLSPDLLSAWTTKEALFKSDPMNHARHLALYECEDVRRSVGTARSLVDGRVLRYATTTVLGLRLSVALAPTREATP